MGLFSRKEQKPQISEAQETGKDPFVKILGSGCVNCRNLEAAARAALEELGMDTAIGHISDFAQIAAVGVMSTPALMINGKVVSYGKVLKKDEIIKLLEKERN